MYVLQVMYMGVTTFGPAAAVESVTNIPTSINIFVIVTICTIYTAMVRHVTIDTCFYTASVRQIYYV